MGLYILDFDTIDKTKQALVGGKGANLGELTKIEGIQVPDGFCVSTDAFKRITTENPRLNELIHQLSLLKTGERNQITALAREIREIL